MQWVRRYATAIYAFTPFMWQHTSCSVTSVESKNKTKILLLERERMFTNIAKNGYRDFLKKIFRVTEEGGFLPYFLLQIAISSATKPFLLFSLIFKKNLKILNFMV